MFYSTREKTTWRSYWSAMFLRLKCYKHIAPLEQSPELGPEPHPKEHFKWSTR